MQRALNEWLSKQECDREQNESMNWKNDPDIEWETKLLNGVCKIIINE